MHENNKIDGTGQDCRWDDTFIALTTPMALSIVAFNKDMTKNPQPASNTILNERITLQAGGLALLAVTFWGGMNVAIKISLVGIPPLALAGVRFIIGVLVVLIWTFLNRVPLKLETGETRGLFQLACLFVAQIGMLYIGTHYTLASRSTVLISTHPFFTAVFAHLFLTGDRLSLLKVIGITFSFLGVVVVFAESIVIKDFHYLPGDLMVLSAGMLLGLRLVYIKRLTQAMHPGKLLIWQSSLSIPIFFALSFIFERDFQYAITPAVVLATLYQGVVIAGFCFILWTLLLRRYMASRLGVFHFVTPIFGVLFSNLFLGEAVSYGIIASMLFVGIGIAIVNYES